MIIKQTFLSFLLTALSFSLSAQQFSGVVSDESESALQGVLVTNEYSGRSTLTNLKGEFSIDVKAGDQISFTFLGFISTNMIIPEFENAIFRKIKLFKKVFTLNEIEIMPDWTLYQLDSLKRRQTYKLTLEREKEGSIMSPVTLLAESLSKKSKMKWKFQKNFQKWESEKYVHTIYNAKEVEELTGLKRDSLAAFMNAYPMSEDYARYASEMEIKMWILYNYRTWIKHPVIPEIDTSLLSAP